jgi:DNA-binding beta-propeller fold protein YncE
VADFSNSRIHQYDPDGNFLGMLTECPETNPATSDYCQDPGETKSPISLAVDSLGSNVYVVDAKGFRIQKFDSKGHYLLGWGFREAIPWLFKEPAGVAVDAKGDVYVTDIFQSIIVKFDPNGNFKTSWTSHYGSGDSYRPTDIATGPSGVYITDFLNNYVYKLNYGGNLQATWGSGHDGAADGEFTYPAAVAVDSLGNIFVADTLNNRIQSFIGTWVSYNCSAQGGITKPFGIAVDSSGNVYVADTWNHRVLKYKYTITTVVMDGCDSGVENKVLDDGSALTSHIAQCADSLASHENFISCVTFLTNEWKKARIITETETDLINRCAEKSTIGR